MKKQPLITEKTRKKLLDAFWQLYENNDMTKIRIKEICEIANYDRTTFYRYFTDINDILNEMEDEIINNLTIAIRKKHFNLTHIPFENFKAFSDTYGNYIIVFYEKGNRRFYLKFKELVKNDVYEYLNLNVYDEDKKEFLYEFLFSSLIISYAYWYRNQSMMNLEAFAKLANGIIMNGAKMIISSIK